MIKEILLSLAVAAFSGVSSFVGSPRRAISTAEQAFGDYSLEFEMHTDDYFDMGWENPFMSVNHQQVDIDGVWYPCYENNNNFAFNVRGTLSNNQVAIDVFFYWVCNGGTAEQNRLIRCISYSVDRTLTEGWNHGQPDYSGSDVRLYVYRSVPVSQETHTLNFTISAAYQLTKNYINCDIASSPVLPSIYGGELAPMKPTYYVTMVSNAGGYGFTSESVTQTGGIVIRNFSLFDQYNNSGYYASCSFTAELPYNDCSITVQAFLPTYTITANLERCTVSPSLPSSYTGTIFSGDYTFTANNGYGFNKNYTHWEVSNLFIDRVEFSNLLWGSFYSSVTLRLRASGGNSSISVTAIEYDEENYKLGYEEGKKDGWQSGYDRGHADGEIAGDSYGVWNWLKQAATTTGEFLSIPLLPGFSIGGLLTALAGLMIIWLFIKGFLFKS